MLFVYEDTEKRRKFKDKYYNYKFVGPSFFIRNSDNLNDILYLVEDKHYDHLIVDISNWIKDGNFYKVYFERFIMILLDNVDDIHFCIKESLLDEFLQWFPDFFDSLRTPLTLPFSINNSVAGIFRKISIPAFSQASVNVFIVFSAPLPVASALAI